MIAVIVSPPKECRKWVFSLYFCFFSVIRIFSPCTYKCWDQSWGVTTKIFFSTDFKILRSSVGFTQAEWDVMIGYFPKFRYSSKKITTVPIGAFFDTFSWKHCFHNLAYSELCQFFRADPSSLRRSTSSSPDAYVSISGEVDDTSPK